MREASRPGKLTEGGGNEIVGYKQKGSTGKVLQDPGWGGLTRRVCPVREGVHL